jgi:hypothetical protein
MANKYVKKCFTSLSIKEMHIKTMKMQRRKGKPSYTVGENLVKSVWMFFRTLKTELPYDPAVALLGIYPNNIQYRHLCTRVYCSTIHYS